MQVLLLTYSSAAVSKSLPAEKYLQQSDPKYSPKDHLLALGKLKIPNEHYRQCACDYVLKDTDHRRNKDLRRFIRASELVTCGPDWVYEMPECRDRSTSQQENQDKYNSVSNDKGNTAPSAVNEGLCDGAGSYSSVEVEDRNLCRTCTEYV